MGRARAVTTLLEDITALCSQVNHLMFPVKLIGSIESGLKTLLEEHSVTSEVQNLICFIYI